MKRRIVFGCALVCGAVAAFGAAPYALTVERLADPCGVDATAPRFGWKMAAKHGAVDVTQSAYRVLVATSRERLAAGEGEVAGGGEPSPDGEGAPNQATLGTPSGVIAHLRCANIRMSDLERIDALLPHAPRFKRGLTFVPEDAENEVWVFVGDGQLQPTNV